MTKIETERLYYFLIKIKDFNQEIVSECAIAVGGLPRRENRP